ncbi:choice-of-anchor D domain-containing protein [Hymenobacter terricola]|uniref:choice-of-anchor D domain-containing protein n=1 Tax=Hymenobacter terricola TaxID=2819236 RepID=UPI001B30A2D7|nr:choice-of-anchor D domain-containing protein [Hymenobacter terricola]
MAIDDVTVSYVTATVPPASPTVTTATPATGLTSTDATIAGNISDLGSPTASTSYGFVYSSTASTTTTLQLTQPGVTAAQAGTTGAAVGNFSTALTGLTPSTTYYYRAYVTNATGTGYGVVQSFTTDAPAAATTITTGAVTGAPICATAAANIQVAFTTTGTITGTYTVQLSDAAGSFTTPTTLVTTGTASPLTATIPAGTASGTGYLVRVVNSAPATTGSNSAAFTIVSNPTVSIAPTATQNILAGANGTALTVTETPASGTTRVWQYAITTGGPYTTVVGQSGTSYTPTFATAGTYYVVATATFAACAAVTSNEVQVNVNNPVPTITSLAPPTAVVGGADITLTVNGTNFVTGSTVTFNGVSRVTTFVSVTRLTVAVLAADIATIGSYNVAVTTAAPGGGTTAATAASTFYVTAPFAGIIEDFETGSKVAYAVATATVTTGPWVFDNSLIGTAAASDLVRGTQSGRLRNAAATSIYMNFDKPNGAGIVTVYAGNFGPDSNGGFALDVSSDGGATWTAYTASRSGLTNSLVQYAFTVNVGGPVRLRFRGTTAGARVDIDDVAIPNYVAPGPEIDVTQGATPIASGGSYAYAATTTGATTTATFTIANTGNTDLNISGIALSNNASGEFSIVTSPLPTTVTAGANTPLQVQFAPTSAGAKTATLTITNDDTNEGSYVITLTGDALPAEPTVQPTVAASAVTITTALLTLSGGDGSKRLVVVRPAATAVAPTDGTTYTANPAYGTTTGSNPTTGTNNFVVVADGSTTSVTITGLAVNTAYTVEAYTYNDNGTAGLENYLTATPGTTSFTTLAPASVTYIWNGTGTSYSAATSWTPDRLVTAPSDVLVFDATFGTPATTTVALDFPGASETIGQLLIRNGVTATFGTDANRTLLLDGNATGTDFVVDATSALTLTNTNTTAARGIAISLTATETAAVSGTLVYDGNASFSGRHSLLSAAANSNAIEFLSGSRLQATAQFDGSNNNSAFGTTTGTSGSVFSVVFRKGATYEQTGGSNPFGLTAPNSFVTFEPTSHYIFDAASGQPSVSGRTYGSLEYNTPSSGVGSSSGSGLLTVLSDLTVTQGNVIFLLNGGINIGGNISVNTSAGALSFAPASTTALPIQLNGTTAQTIEGTSPAGTLTFGPNAILQINNAAGVSLLRPIGLSKELRLTSGLLTTTATNLLALEATAVASGGSGTSFVNGPLARNTPAGLSTATAYLFPVGKVNFYRPFILTLTAQAAASTYTAEQIEGDPNPTGAANILPGNGLGSASLKRVSKFRAFTLASSTTTANNALGTVTLSFGTGDGVNDPANTGLVVAASTGGSPFGNLDRSAYTGTGTGAGGAEVIGTLTSALISTGAASATFVPGATNDNVTFGQAINPLPVELTVFSAQRQSGNAVSVAWTTASEKNSAYFEVQRSLDGREFATVATAAGQGTSSQINAYTALDKTAPAAQLYYRLRQVDRNGTAAFSPVVTVAGSGSVAKVLLYPNPAQGSISFLVAAAMPYRVLNQLGQPLLHGTTETGTTTIALDKLVSGLYFLELQTAAGRVVQKFEKE